MRTGNIISAVCILSMLIAWCGGYDFDHRGVIVAGWVLGTIWMCGFIVIMDKALNKGSKEQ